MQWVFFCDAIRILCDAILSALEFHTTGFSLRFSSGGSKVIREINIAEEGEPGDEATVDYHNEVTIYCSVCN